MTPTGRPPTRIGTPVYARGSSVTASASVFSSAPRAAASPTASSRRQRIVRPDSITRAAKLFHRVSERCAASSRITGSFAGSTWAQASGVSAPDSSSTTMLQ